MVETNGEDEKSVLSEARNDENWEAAVTFYVEPPFDTKSTPEPGDVECIMWDYGKGLRTPHKATEKLNEHFALALGYNVYLFVLHDARAEKSCFYIYGEEHDSKGTNMVISMVHDYLENHEKMRRCKVLVIVVDNCSGEKKTTPSCATSFYEIPNIQKAHAIEFLEDDFLIVKTRWRNTYNGEWMGKMQGSKKMKQPNWSMRLPIRERVESEVNGKTVVSMKIVRESGKIAYQSWPPNSPAVTLPAPSLSMSRDLHIHETILPHVSDEKKEWWLQKAPKEVAEGGKSTRKANSAPALTYTIATGNPLAVVQRIGTAAAFSTTIGVEDVARE